MRLLFFFGLALLTTLGCAVVIPAEAINSLQAWIGLFFLLYPLRFDHPRPGPVPTFGCSARPRPLSGEPVTVTQRVTVWKRMEVGDYDVAVLSATGVEVLIEWLNENGFAFPSEAEEIAADYVHKQWYFVALRIRPGVQQEQPVLQDVKSIGIRFPAEQLTYPLKISAVSAPEKTSLFLVLLADEKVTCNELTVMEPEVKTERPPGSCYTSVVKELLDRENGEAFFCEYRGPVDTSRYWQIMGPAVRWAQIGGAPLFVVTLHVIVFALLLVGFQRLLRRRRTIADQAPELDRTAVLTFSILVGILLSLTAGRFR